jgi:hypothetical protein
MPNVLDKLIAEGTLEPLVVVFVNPVNRGPEYVGNQVPQYVRLVVEELIPWVEARFSVSTSASRRGIMGTSNGGYISARVGRDHPEKFLRIGCQSGALEADGGGVVRRHRRHLRLPDGEPEHEGGPRDGGVHAPLHRGERGPQLGQLARPHRRSAQVPLSGSEPRLITSTAFA